jgi:hypothetical protein
MKKILLSLTAATLLFSSCDKDDDGDYVSNTWMTNGMMHHVVNSARVGGNFTISVNDGNLTTGYGLTFVFAGAPTTGSYNIVDFPTQPNEVAIAASEGSLLNIYRSTADETRKVTVKVDGNGRATVYLQGASLKPVLPGGENIEATASIRENY